MTLSDEENFSQKILWLILSSLSTMCSRATTLRMRRAGAETASFSAIATCPPKGPYGESILFFATEPEVSPTKWRALDSVIELAKRHFVIQTGSLNACFTIPLARPEVHCNCSVEIHCMDHLSIRQYLSGSAKKRDVAIEARCWGNRLFALQIGQNARAFPGWRHSRLGPTQTLDSGGITHHFFAALSKVSMSFTCKVRVILQSETPRRGHKTIRDYLLYQNAKVSTNVAFCCLSWALF